MLIYQVLDEENHPVAEYSAFELAKHEAEDLTLWHEEHYYHVESILIDDL